MFCLAAGNHLNFSMFGDGVSVSSLVALDGDVMTLSPVIRYSLLSLTFTVPAAWALLTGGCLLWPRAEVCGLPYLYVLAALGVVVLTIAPLGWTYLERARRKAGKGMWRRGGVPGGGVSSVKSAFKALWDEEHRIGWGESSGEIISGEMRFERRRWLIPVRNGQVVYVDRRVFWRWLEQVEALAQTLPPGESPVGMRRWRGQVVEGQRLREGDVLAFHDILAAVGRFEYATPDVRSRRYVSKPGAVWGAVEEFEKVQRSEPY